LEITQKESVRVLIVADTQAEVVILQRHFKNCHRYNVKNEYATDMQNLWDKLSDEQFDLVFLENRLAGGITALDVLRDFQNKEIDTPTVIMIDQGDQRITVELMKKGAYDYITKGHITTDLLERVIYNTIERHKLAIIQKQNQEKLKKSEERYRCLVNAVTDYIFTVRFKNGYPMKTIHNEACVAVTGYTAQDFAADPHLWINMVHPDDQSAVRKQALQCISGQDTEPLEHRIICKDGSTRWVKNTLVRHFDSQGKLQSYDGLLKDITERKQTQKKQTELLKQIEKANREQKEFAYVASHDLKAPLRGISSLAGWISSDYGDKLGDKGQEQIDLLLGRVDRMQKLIDGILQYSRVGRVEEEKMAVDLNELVPEIIDLLAPPENIEIVIDNELPAVECGETRITQVFQNLLSNAVKYIDKPQGQIRIGCVEEGNCWKFSVADNGSGIEEEHFERIFQIFQTLSRHDENGGTGIGLTVVKKIVELYGGEIWVESKLGEGTTFLFTLPKQEIGVKNEKIEANIIS